MPTMPFPSISAGHCGAGGGQMVPITLPPPSLIGSPKIWSGEFPQTTESVTVGLLSLLRIPPPLTSAVFPLNVQSVTVGLLLPKLAIPPPLFETVFPLNVQPVTIGLLLTKLYIPPPLPVGAMFPLNVQLVTIGSKIFVLTEADVAELKSIGEFPGSRN